jgi:hypothetical protein
MQACLFQEIGRGAVASPGNNRSRFERFFERVLAWWLVYSSLKVNVEEAAFYTL